MTTRLIQTRIFDNPYIPHVPTPKQAAFLALTCREALFGGSAGGGKSDALLMAALMYIDEPGYAALLLRRTYADLSLPEALMDRANEWLRGTNARYNDRDKTWIFPSGATLTFGYLAVEKDKYRYQSSAFQFIGYDELTQFTESQYTYPFSRLRRLAGSQIPLRMRSASNPGGIGHAWVYERFPIDRTSESTQTRRVFIPAGLADNPYIDSAEYIHSLAELDDITKKQLLEGVWITDPAGRPFKRDWWRGLNRYHADSTGPAASAVGRWMSWDTAMKAKEENAYTAVTVGELTPDYYLNIRQVWRHRLEFPDLPNAIEDFARQYNQDGKLRAVIIEDKSSGTSAIQTLTKTAEPWLQSLIVPFQPSGDKIQRAQQAAVWCKRDCVRLPHPGRSLSWLFDFEKELFGFPDTQFKDQVDSFSQLILYIEPLLAEGWHARGEG